MLLILTGKTASGKDTLVAKILEKYPDFRKVITSTSRSPREDEKNGVDYSFVSADEFKQKIAQGDFLEYVEYGGNFYGTEKSQLNPKENLIWKIDPSMAGKAKAVFRDSTIIYINSDNETVLKRLRERGLSEEEVVKRMQDDQRFWQFYHDKYDYIVENVPGNLQVAVDKICEIIDAQK